MARTAKTVLTVKAVESIKEPGRYADAQTPGLYFSLDARGNRSWVFRFTSPVTKARRELGIGSASNTTLAQARQRATEARELVDAGTDPIDARRAGRAAPVERKVVTFEALAREYYKKRVDDWVPEHAREWIRSLERHVFPLLGTADVATVSREDVRRAVAKVFDTSTENGRRILKRIAVVLDFAVYRGERSEDRANAAVWVGGHEFEFKRGARKPIRHMPSMPWADVPKFFAELASHDAPSARALELQLLTVARPNEIAGMRWSELTLDGLNPCWTIPAERMKMRKLHRVPLVPAAVEVLRMLEASKQDGVDFVFPSKSGLSHLKKQALLEYLKGVMKQPDYTAHGFRASFSTWANDTTSFDSQLIESCLAHETRTKVRRAYDRGDALTKRRVVLDAWAAHVLGTAKVAEVVDLGRFNAA